MFLCQVKQVKVAVPASTKRVCGADATARRAAFTAAQRATMYSKKREQCDKITKDRKQSRDAIGAGALARAQKSAKVLFAPTATQNAR